MAVSTGSVSQIYHNARVFVASSASLQPSKKESDAYFADAFYVRPDGKFGPIGTVAHVRASVPDGTPEVDLQGQLVLPGLIEGHTHLSMLGNTLDKGDLEACTSLEQIQQVVGQAVRSAPAGTERLRFKNWLQDQTDGLAPASAIDQVSGDLPIYIDSRDLHSMWLNTAALAEVGITKDTPDPHGGWIAHDDQGNPSGLLSENAVMTYAWTALGKLITPQEEENDLVRAFDAYLASGYTGGVDMAMTDAGFAAIQRVQTQRGGDLPIRISAYWFIEPSNSLEDRLKQVRKVAAQRDEERNARTIDNDDPHFKTVGIKIVSDGVIDGCTAAVTLPYANGATSQGIWSMDDLLPVVQLADQLGLQVATHAIGDAAIHNAVQAYASLVPDGQDHAQQVRDKRHRIEHLELSNPEDVDRLGKLGIIASIQPVHSDPQILTNWWAMLGDEPNQGRSKRAFAYSHMVQAGAPIAIGTDAPTASHWAMPNVHDAVHRTSALNRKNTIATTPEFALPLATTLTGAAYGAAFSVRREDVCGSIEEGKSADWCVVGTDVFEATAKGTPWAILDAQVEQTYLRGKQVFHKTE